ncbi:hypothetical protein [Microbacterium sp. S1037]|uniref:hypothetical protein n=1 Tax=Microbacterium sp. S1037 TaxID=3398227 RepID=UPI003AAFD639
MTGDEETAEPPLVAARHLLGFYAYPVDPEEPFGVAKKSLRGRLTKENVGKNKFRTFKIGARQEIAASEARYGSRTTLSGKGSKLPKVAAAVWSAMKVEFTKLTPDQLEDLRQNALSDGRPDWHRANGDPEGWVITRAPSVDEGSSGGGVPCRSRVGPPARVS